MLYWLETVLTIAVLGTISFWVSLVVGVVLHEFGHYIAFKRGGVPVSGFSVGEGTPLWQGVLGRTLFKVNLNPFKGGSVEITEEALETYKLKGPPSIWIPASGPLVNLILLLLSVIVLSSTPMLIGAALAQVLILLCAFSVEEEAPYSDGQHMESILRTGSFKT